MRDIQVFFSFANFYPQFIKGFSKIASSLTFMLTTSLIQSAKLLPLSIDVINNVEFGSSGSDKIIEKSLLLTKRTIRATSYLTSDAKIAFTQLRKTFIKIATFCHFDPKYYIWIETDTSRYAIDRVLN